MEIFPPNSSQPPPNQLLKKLLCYALCEKLLGKKCTHLPPLKIAFFVLLRILVPFAYRVTLLTQFIQVKAIFACFFTTRYVQAYTLYMKLKTNYK